MDQPAQSLFGRVTGYLQGRHTAFAAAFFILGNVMHWFHRLDATYITFMGTLMGFVLGHSVKESMLPDDNKTEKK
jgi:hypothetical protein